MNVRVKIFGSLKDKLDLENEGAGIPTIISQVLKGDSRIADVFEKLHLNSEETSHIFVNGQYSGLKKRIEEGDTIAIFPTEMGLLYKWYFNKQEDE